MLTSLPDSTPQILATAPPTSPLPSRGVFQLVPNQDAALAQDVCLEPGALELAAVSVYINGTFAWCGDSGSVGLTCPADNAQLT